MNKLNMNMDIEAIKWKVDRYIHSNTWRNRFMSLIFKQGRKSK